MRKNLITILSLVMAVTLVGVNVYADPEKATETVVIEEVATEEKTTEETAEEKSAEETTTEEKAEETTSEESAKGAEEKEAATEEELEELLKEAKDASEATPEDYFTFDSTTGTLTNFHPKEAIETLVIPAKIGGGGSQAHRLVARARHDGCYTLDYKISTTTNARINQRIGSL